VSRIEITRERDFNVVAIVETTGVKIRKIELSMCGTLKSFEIS
jgi:hypothetical protein